MILFQSGLAYECTVSKLSSLSLKSRKIKVPCVPSNDGVGDSAFCTFDNGIQFSLARTTSLPTSTINYINSVHNQCCKSGVRKEIFWSVRWDVQMASQYQCSQHRTGQNLPWKQRGSRSTELPWTMNKYFRDGESWKSSWFKVIWLDINLIIRMFSRFARLLVSFSSSVIHQYNRSPRGQHSEFLA